MKALFQTLLLLLLLLISAAARAQSVGIGTPTPLAGAALEIKATDRGLLIPRLTAAQRTGIASPPQGLMVYQTDGTAGGGAQTGFWYYAGTGGWVLIDPAAGGLALPYSGTAATSGSVFQLTNTGAGGAIFGTSGGTDPNAVTLGGFNSGAGAGVYGGASSGTGVVANSGSGPAFSATKSGFQTGRLASLINLTATNDSTALSVSTAGDRPAVRALNTAPSAQAAIRGVKKGTSTDGIGVEGVITSGAGGNAAGVLGNDQTGTGAGSGVIGLTAGGYGVRGIASAAGGYGVSGSATTSYGVIGGSDTGTGVYGSTQAGSTGAVAGVKGNSSNQFGTGVLGTTTRGVGVAGTASGNAGVGVQGEASGSSGFGVVGAGNGAATAVAGNATGTGRAAFFTQTNASSTANAVEIQNAGNGAGLKITTTDADAYGLDVSVVGQGSPAARLYTQRLATNLELGTNPAASNGCSIDFRRGSNLQGRIRSEVGPGISNFLNLSAADNGGLLAVRITLDSNPTGLSALYGNWAVGGNLSKAGGSFKIDHPLDPENQYLYHSFVESPDMLNVYNGNVTLDARGEATVPLPDYFEALNRDFRYQLTPIGAAFTPYVLAKVAGNRFRVAGQPGAEVSWQVTGIRQDRWANANRIPTAVAKEPENRGKYLHPAAFGRPESQGVGHRGRTAAPAATVLAIQSASR